MRFEWPRVVDKRIIGGEDYLHGRLEAEVVVGKANDKSLG